MVLRQLFRRCFKAEQTEPPAGDSVEQHNSLFNHVFRLGCNLFRYRSEVTATSAPIDEAASDQSNTSEFSQRPITSNRSNILGNSLNLNFNTRSRHIGSFINTESANSFRTDVVLSSECGRFCYPSFERSALTSAQSSWNRFSSDHIRGMNNLSQRPFDRHLIVQSPRIDRSSSKNNRISLQELRLIKSLGSGSFGDVGQVRVKSAFIGAAWYHGFTDFVIKKVRKDQLAINEEKVASLINGHPNLVKYIGHSTNASYMYIGLERLRGPNLGDLLDRIGRFSQVQAHILITDVVRGLAHMHSKGIAHLDIKLDNIMLSNPVPESQSGHSATIFSGARILDFGLAEICPTGECFQSRWLTGGGGSIGYMSPGQMSGMAFSPPKGDIFSLGVLWFVLLTGRMPFTEDSLRSSSRFHRSVLYGRMRLYKSEVSKRTANMVIHCLMAEEERRPTIDEVLHDLESTNFETDLCPHPSYR